MSHALGSEQSALQVVAGHDKGTTSVNWPTDAALMAQAKVTLYADAAWDGGAKW